MGFAAKVYLSILSCQTRFILVSAYGGAFVIVRPQPPGGNLLHVLNRFEGIGGVYPFMLDRLARSANSEGFILMPKPSRLNSSSTFISRNARQSPRRSSRTSKAIYGGYGAKTETIFHKGAANSKKHIAFVQML